MITIPANGQPLYFMVFAGLSTDRPKADRKKHRFAVFQNWDVCAAGDGKTLEAATPDGFRLINHVPIQYDPDGGATDDAHKRTISHMEFDFRSAGIAGNILAAVCNGDGSGGSVDRSVGRDGQVLGIHQAFGYQQPHSIYSINVTLQQEPVEPVTPNEAILWPSYLEPNAPRLNSIEPDRSALSNAETGVSLKDYIPLGVDSSGLQWFAKRPATGTSASTIHYYADTGISASVGSIAVDTGGSSQDLCGIGLVGDSHTQGCYVLSRTFLGSPTRSNGRLFRVTRSGVTQVALTGITFGSDVMTTYSGPLLGLSYATNGDLVFLVLDWSTPYKYFVVKVDPSTGAVRTNYPADTGLTTTLTINGTRYVECLQLGPSGLHYFQRWSSASDLGIYTMMVGSTLSGITELWDVSTTVGFSISASNGQTSGFVVNAAGHILWAGIEAEGSSMLVWHRAQDGTTTEITEQGTPLAFGNFDVFFWTMTAWDSSTFGIGAALNDGEGNYTATIKWFDATTGAYLEGDDLGTDNGEVMGYGLGGPTQIDVNGYQMQALIVPQVGA